MKKPVLERALFAKVSPKSESKGILSGIAEDDEEFERRPDDLEIIANNIRGDMRSMDERYLELAQMVGESAFDTPEEVVTLMQAQFAQQQQPPIPAPAPTQQGIGALPQSPSMPQTDGGIMSGIAEPQQEPAQMAHGGIVHRQLGSPPTAEVAGDFPANSRRLGFMKYLPQGTLAGPGQAAVRSTTVPHAVVQQTAPMTGFLSGEAANYLTSNAARPTTLPPRVDLATQIGTRVAEGARNILPFAREVGRTIMSTPQGRVAGAIGGTALMATPFLMGESTPTTAGERFSEVPGVDAEGRYRPIPLTEAGAPRTPAQMPQVPQAGEKVPAPPEPGAGGGATPVPGAKPPGERLLPEEERYDFTRVSSRAAAAAEQPKDFRTRVRDKIDVYKEFLGEDENMRKAQALFLLAESALNLAGATGRSDAERLAKGLKGLPAGMAALGAEKTKQDMAVKSAAISAVEQEIASENKIAGQYAIQNLKLQPKIGKLMREADMLSRMHNIDGDTAMFLAQGLDDGTIVRDEVGDLVDRTGKPIPGASRAAPSQPKDVGFLDPRMPGVVVSDRFMQRATSKQKGDFIERKQNNQDIILRTEEILKDVEGIVGPIPSIQSGITKAYLPLFGASGIGLTDAQQLQLRNNSKLLYERLMETYRRNKGRPSVFEQQEISKLVGSPDDFFQAPERVIGVLANISRDAMNDNARIDSMLNPGTPLKQLEVLPLGTKDSPITLGPNSDLLLGEVFRVRPNSQIYVTVGGKLEMIDGNRYRQQTQGGTR